MVAAIARQDSSAAERLSGVRDDRHPYAAPAAGGLHDHRIPDLIRDAAGAIEPCHARVAAGRHRNSCLDHLPAGRYLVAHKRKHSARRSDELETLLFARKGEQRVLGEEAVTGMNGPGTASAGRFHHAVMLR